MAAGESGTTSHRVKHGNACPLISGTLGTHVQLKVYYGIERSSSFQTGLLHCIFHVWVGAQATDLNVLSLVITGSLASPWLKSEVE